MITLYTAPTGNGYRASILLEEVDLPYRTRSIDFAAGAHRSPEFLDLNPIGKIPVIVDDDAGGGAPVVVAESLAIALYLVEKTGRLSPPTPQDRARAWTWGSAAVSGFGSSFTSIFYARQTGADAHAAYIAKCFEDLDFQFAAMDRHLSDHAYLAGDAYSWADALAAPLIGTADRFAIDLSPLPALARWTNEILSRPAVQRGLAPPSAAD